MHDKRQMKRYRCMWDSDWAGDLLGRKKEHDRCDREKRQTFVETHVMFADACCIIERRS